MPKNVVLRLYLDKGLLNEGDDLLLVGVGGRRKCKEVQIVCIDWEYSSILSLMSISSYVEYGTGNINSSIATMVRL